MHSKKPAIIFIVLVLGLCVRLFFYFQNQTKYIDGQKAEITTRLTEEPQINYGHQQFRIKDGNGERISIVTGLTPMYKYGDRIRIKGKISLRNYKGHVFAGIRQASIQIDPNDHNLFAGLSAYIRRNATKLFQNNLPPALASLLNGIIFGGNQGVPDRLLAQLRDTGVIHVISASGMNVTFVAGALTGVLGVFFKRQIALTIAVFGVLFYAFMSGFEPSIVRAAIMSILAFSASLLGRQNFALVAVFITGMIMLFLSPYLLGDVGFQLSFAATIGILLIKPLFPHPGSFPFLDDVWTTIAAQIATLPILLSVFGSYGLLSILVNALVLWTVPVLMVLGSIGLIFGLIFEPIGRLFLFLADPILFYFVKIVQYFGSFGWTLTIPEVSGFIWTGYYFLLFSGIILIKQYRAKNNLNRENTP